MPESETLVAVVTQGSTMDASAVATIGVLVTLLTTVIKRSVPGDIDCYGLLIAATVSALGVGLWVVSAPLFPPPRTDYWAIGAGYVSVLSTAVGVYEMGKVVTRTAPIRRRPKSDLIVPEGGRG